MCVLSETLAFWLVSFEGHSGLLRLQLAKHPCKSLSTHQCIFPLSASPSVLSNLWWEKYCNNMNGDNAISNFRVYLYLSLWDFASIIHFDFWFLQELLLLSLPNFWAWWATYWSVFLILPWPTNLNQLWSLEFQFSFWSLFLLFSQCFSWAWWGTYWSVFLN